MRIAHVGMSTPTDILAEALVNLGHEVEVFRKTDVLKLGTGTPYRGPQHLYKLRKFDVIHLNAHRLLPFALETLIPGRKIVLHHHGCDVLGKGEPRGAQWAHHRFCNYDLVPWCPGAQVLPLPVEKSVDWSGFENGHVLHGETAPEKAGTRHVIDACRNLGVELVRWQSERKLWQHKMELARVVIGKVSRWHGMPGMTPNEAMAMGKPVLCWVSERVRRMMPSGLPVVSVTPETLHVELERVLQSRTLREELGGRGREYVQTHHDPKLVAEICAEVYGR